MFKIFLTTIVLFQQPPLKRPNTPTRRPNRPNFSTKRPNYGQNDKYDNFNTHRPSASSDFDTINLSTSFNPYQQKPNKHQYHNINYHNSQESDFESIQDFQNNRRPQNRPQNWNHQNNDWTHQSSNNKPQNSRPQSSRPQNPRPQNPTTSSKPPTTSSESSEEQDDTNIFEQMESMVETVISDFSDAFLTREENLENTKKNLTQAQRKDGVNMPQSRKRLSAVKNPTKHGLIGDLETQSLTLVKRQTDKISVMDSKSKNTLTKGNLEFKYGAVSRKPSKPEFKTKGVQKIRKIRSTSRRSHKRQMLFEGFFGDYEDDDNTQFTAETENAPGKPILNTKTVIISNNYKKYICPGWFDTIYDFSKLLAPSYNDLLIPRWLYGLFFDKSKENGDKLTQNVVATNNNNNDGNIVSNLIDDTTTKPWYSTIFKPVSEYVSSEY